MKVLRYILLAILLLIVVIAVGGFLIFNDWTRGPLPQHEGSVSVRSGSVGNAAQAVDIDGLGAPVEIIRDNWGVAHIYASTSYDLFFAQGYTQAQDRWWQMEFSRHIGAGRIGELTGKNNAVLGNDLFIRKFGWYAAAQRDWNAMSEESKAVLEAFADGVNAYVLNRDKNDLALEYNLLGVTGVNITVDPWTPVDSLAWAKVMADNLSGNWESEVLRSELTEVLGEEMTNQFMPTWPFGDKPTILKAEDLPISEASLSSGSDTAGLIGIDNSFATDYASNNLAAAFGKGAGIGSNNWVVSGELTASGKPLLANDPHLGIQMPSIWYEVGLHCETVGETCPFNVTGFALPATPGVIIGHNDRIAWGVTNVGPDVQDLYRIKVNPENELQYEWNGEWRDMTVREEVINFGDGEAPITLQVRETHLGPIINDYEFDSETGEVSGYNNEEPLAFHWTAIAETSTILDSAVRLNMAQNWEEFREALSYWDVPSQNFVYADVDGNIGYQVPGRVPVRAEGHSGLLPVDGSTDEFEWLGYIPFDELPRAFNPERGFIATANQAVVPLEYYDQLRDKLAGEFGENANYFISQEWAYGYRGQRIEELLTTTGPHTAETFAVIHGDNKMISAEELAPYIAALEFDDAALTEARDWMLDWDYQMHMDSPKAALYGYYWARLLQDLFEDQLGEIVGPAEGDMGMWAVYLLVEEPENIWWDDVNTADATETRDDILKRAFAEAHAALVEQQGQNRDSWAWGKLHTSTFVSNPLGLSGISLIEDMVNRGPAATSGGSDIVNATGWDFDREGFAVRSLPSMRYIADLSDLSASQTMHTTGQSGHPYSPHYGDMIDPWRLIQYHPMLWTREQVDAAAVSTLTLNPG